MKLKKLGKIGTLRLELELANQEIASLRVSLQRADKACADLHREAEALQIKLNEARRHTLKMEGGSEINFKPLGVLSVDHQVDTMPIFSRMGGEENVVTSRRCTLKVLAEVVEDPPVIYQLGKPRLPATYVGPPQIPCKLCQEKKPGVIELIQHIRADHNVHSLLDAKHLIDKWREEEEAA